jgi:hypothetical protein
MRSAPQHFNVLVVGRIREVDLAQFSGTPDPRKEEGLENLTGVDK